MAEGDPVVTLEGVTVTYGNNRALRDVTSSFAAGAVGLLGPNGAGKSTMIKSLLGFIVPERGRLRVLGLAHNKGVNLILCSHLLPDVEYTCDHVVVMDKGAIATAGPIAALKQPRGRVYELRVKSAADLDQFVGRLRAAGLECKQTDE